MAKIVLNGAGSVEFTKELLADILGFDELAGSTIALFDTDAERLETAAAIARNGQHMRLGLASGNCFPNL